MTRELRIVDPNDPRWRRVVRKATWLSRLEQWIDDLIERASPLLLLFSIAFMLGGLIVLILVFFALDSIGR